MLIYVITHTRYIPLFAYCNKATALKHLEQLKQDRQAVGSYGMIELKLIGKKRKESSLEKTKT